jgi:hypothetical protein
MTTLNYSAISYFQSLEITAALTSRFLVKDFNTVLLRTYRMAHISQLN